MRCDLLREGRMNLENHKILVELIYQASIDGHLWKNVLEQLAISFNASCGAFFLQKGYKVVDDRYLTYGIEEKDNVAYLSHFYQFNPFFSLMDYSKPCHIVTNEDVDNYLGGSPRYYLNSQFYNEWQRGLGDARYSFIFNLKNHHDSCVNFSLMRSSQQGCFTEADKNQLYILGNVMITAMDMSDMRVEREKYHHYDNTLAHSLDAGILHLDERDNISFANDIGKQMLDVKTPIYELRSKLKFVFDEDRKKYLQKFSEVFNSLNKARFILGNQSSHILSCAMIPCRREFDYLGRDYQKVLLIIKNENNQISLNFEYISQRWNLTCRETEFCTCLLTGKSIAEIAGKLNIKASSARSLSKVVMKKLGVHSQSNIIRKILLDLGVFLRH